MITRQDINKFVVDERIFDMIKTNYTTSLLLTLEKVGEAESHNAARYFARFVGCCLVCHFIYSDFISIRVDSNQKWLHTG